MKSHPSIWPVLVVLFGLPLAIIAARQPVMPTAEFLNEFASLAGRHTTRMGISHILLVPLGALVVVFARLTLGLRVLGPFRSILLAWAFVHTGIPLGLAFLSAITAIMVGIRPFVHSLELPYFGRVTVMLSTVAVIMIATVIVGRSLEASSLEAVASFPIVVLCLVADAFARTMNEEGARSALWRGAMTALVAVVLTWMAKTPAIQDALVRYPELLIAQVGCIIFISRKMAWRLFQRKEADAPSVELADAQCASDRKGLLSA